MQVRKETGYLNVKPSTTSAQTLAWIFSAVFRKLDVPDLVFSYRQHRVNHSPKKAVQLSLWTQFLCSAIFCL